jgi:predicted RNA-binding Zn-ribbon protein involved in translation (DUF1610 family)
MLEVVGLPNIVKTNLNANLLLHGMLEKESNSVDPVLSPLSKVGFSYPDIEGALKLQTTDVADLLNSLASNHILDKRIFGTFMVCPYCGSSNLKSAVGCPNCGSDRIARGRILEHFFCGNVKLEEEYIEKGRYVCPKCHKDVKYLGTDYRSIGVKYYCHNCEYIFDDAVPLRKCMKCSRLFFQKNAKVNAVYSYRLDDEQRCHLQFDFGPKRKLMNFLKLKGYMVTENARVKGDSKSGAEYSFDLLASRYDGVIEYNICLDVAIDSKNQEIGLEEVFKFDSKTYDLGIHDRILLVDPDLSEKAKKFASKQHILVLKKADIDTIVESSSNINPLKSAKLPFKFTNKAELLQYLRRYGYTVQEKASIKGRSGVMHVIDIYAYLYDELINHSVDIGILNNDEEIGTDPVFLFDTKAYDIGAHDKILVAIPGLTPEAKQFAQHQRIKVIELSKQNVAP